MEYRVSVDDFNKIVSREHTASLKYDGCRDIFGRSDLLPLWVADMDFCTPEFVFNAIERKIKDRILGYYIHPEILYQSIIGWMMRRHQWSVEKDWIYFSDGVMPSIFLLIQVFTSPGDKVLVQTPVYSPFYSAIENQGRIVIKNPLLVDKDHYVIDFQNLEICLKQGVRAMILCNPHNPVGRCWSMEELKTIGALCLKYNCLIIADEVHSDVVMPGYKHIPISSASEQIALNSIVCMSPSKAFNVAGLSTSIVIIQNAILRERYEKFRQGIHLSQGNIFGEVALESCYSHGEEWLSTMLRYIKGNVDYVQEFIAGNISGIRTFRHDATYLLWLDFSSLDLSHEEISRSLIEKAGLALCDGTAYGEEGKMHFRMNVACQKARLEMAMEKMKVTFG